MLTRSPNVHVPLDTHLEAIKGLRYLNGTFTYGMTLKPPLHLSLVGLSDADWGYDFND